MVVNDPPQKLVFIVESLWTGKVRSKLVNETVHGVHLISSLPDYWLYVEAHYS